MKKLLLPLLLILLVTACQKQNSTDKIPEEIATVATAKGPMTKIPICHHDSKKNTWKTITINLSQWPDHQAHGDVRLDDQDGDGYVPNNECGYGAQGDCNDNDAAINPGAGNCLVIGAHYQGGIIAYIDGTGLHGLIAAPGDQGLASWGCLNTTISGADGTAIGTGNQNTLDIIAGCSQAGIAAKICADLVLNGYDDWYLPSKDELNQLYINRVAIGGFNDPEQEYWSSSEGPVFDQAGSAWEQEIGTGLQATLYKTYPYAVRAVRSF
ncbi:MAG: DUF1566 domain-containing protein [Bacteroidota bacterium]